MAGLVCAVSFERYGRLHYLDPGDVRPRVGDRVLVPTDDGPEVAECVWAPEWVTDDFGPLPVLVGLASEGDLARDTMVRARKAEAKRLVKQLTRAAGLPMKVVGIDYVDRAAAGGRYTVYFSAPERVDFRALVSDLSRALDAKVDLRQVGARDEARLQGGIGSCGRDLCCATFLKDFEPVSIRMAKEQDLPLNPLKISGACGRLMCCLKYEHPLYQEARATWPRRGDRVTTSEGEAATVVAQNVPAESLTLRMEDGSHRRCALASVCGSRQAYESAHADGAAGGSAPTTGG